MQNKSVGDEFGPDSLYNTHVQLLIASGLGEFDDLDDLLVVHIDLAFIQELEDFEDDIGVEVHCDLVAIGIFGQFVSEELRVGQDQLVSGQLSPILTDQFDVGPLWKLEETGQMVDS